MYLEANAMAESLYTIQTNHNLNTRHMDRQRTCVYYVQKFQFTHKATQVCSVKCVTADH